MFFASLFKDTGELHVPDEYIAATVGLCKKCKRIKGAAWAKRQRLQQEITTTKNSVASKIKFMKIPEVPT
jgi:hypothetical protein